ncbi:alpha/beta hydrolase [Bacillus sp. 7586-K]|nr:alpha/beta hydrolase [Bacillus sp. 7586-K]
MYSKLCISYGEHPSQFGELRKPKSSILCPVVVLIHGGFWQSKYHLEENHPIADDLTRRGYATWNIEYRRVGESGGGWSGTFNDVIAAINHLSNLKESYLLDLSNVVIVGHSAGGHLALWLAARNETVQSESHFIELDIPIKKVISLAGVTDLKKMRKIHEEKGIKSPVDSFIGGTPQMVAERYENASPMELLPKKVEQILIHGELDRHVPVQQSKDYYNKLKEQEGNVSLVVLPDVEHFKIIDPTSIAWNSVISSI